MSLNPGIQTSPAAAAPPTFFQSERFKVLLALATVYVIWGSTYLALRFAVESFPPFGITGIRFLIAGGLMLGWRRLRGDPLPTRIQWRNVTLIGGLMLGCGTGGVAFAEQWVASGLAALAVAAVPIWAALFAGLWGRFPRRMEWIGLAVGLAGVALLNLENGMQANPTGALALIIGPMCWAFGSMLSRQLDLPKGLMAVGGEMLGGGAVLMVISLVLGERYDKEVTTASVVAMLYLITFGALIAFSAYMYLLQTVRPVLATSYAYVNPVVAVLLGVLLANETITPVGIAAMGIILSGVALLAFSRGRQAAAT